jgi:hypothetical protein
MPQDPLDMKIVRTGLALAAIVRLASTPARAAETETAFRTVTFEFALASA